jgi:hypothetical protein
MGYGQTAPPKEEEKWEGEYEKLKEEGEFETGQN